MRNYFMYENKRRNKFLIEYPKLFATDRHCCHQTASDANLLDDPHTFHCIDFFAENYINVVNVVVFCDYFVIGGIRTWLEVSDDPTFLRTFSNSWPLNLLLVRSHQAEIIIVNRFIQARNSVTRVRVEPRSFDQGRCKNDAFTLSASLPTSKRNIPHLNHSINIIQ